MSELIITELLQQGNVSVLTALINRLLMPHSMVATLEKCDRRLTMAIASSPRLTSLDFCIPEPQGMVEIVQRLFLRLNVRAIERVNLSWQLSQAVQDLGKDWQFDRNRYAWDAEFNLLTPETLPEIDAESHPSEGLAFVPATNTKPLIPAPSDRIGQQLVQYAIATLVMACLFLGIHFAINNSKPAKNNTNSAPSKLRSFT